MLRLIGGTAYRARWLVLVLWLALLAVVTLALPDLGSVVTHHAVPNLPDSSTVIQAENLLQRVDPTHHARSSAVLVLQGDGTLTPAQLSYFSQAVRRIGSHASTYNLSSIVDANVVGAALRSQFVSKDGCTVLAVAGFPTDSMSDASMNGVVALRDALANPPAGTRTYVTGDAAIRRDTVKASQDGVQKTGGVTVLLVLLILLVVYRAPLAALVPLVAIGLSFLTTSRIVAVLGEHGLPVSSFTQTFLIAVLFGAGTDYCLLFLSRFREELYLKQGDRHSALDRTLAGVGKTVVFSGLTVLVSFTTLFFAGFGIYRSAAGVCIGLAITLLACFTLVPALLGVLGPALFWPRHPKPGAEHPDSRIWGWTARVATAKPWITVAVVLVILAPIALFFQGQRTFDPLAEYSSSLPSIEGLHAVSQGFGTGRALPMSIVLQTSSNLHTPAGLTTINRISQTLAAQSVVQEIDSASQPAGSPIAAFRLTTRDSQVAQGIAALQSGATQLASGLSASASGLQQIQQSVAARGGTSTLLAQSLGRVNIALRQEAQGAARLAATAVRLHDALAAGAGAEAQGDPGFYVPAPAIDQNATLRQALDAYISPDGHIAKITVILKGNPYAETAIDAVPRLVDAAQVALSASPINTGTVRPAQTTPEQWNLNNVSQDDFLRTAVLVLVTVLVLLIALLRSVVAPLYVIFSLVIAYFVTMTAIQWVFVDVVGKPGVSWAVPFFMFFLLVALGVDYSIFLMSRYDEEYVRRSNAGAAMNATLRAMGIVIFSAAMIMAGTFGSLTASGMTTLLEIGTGIIIGLLLYTVIMLGFFVPACATIAGSGHYWPLKRTPVEQGGEDRAGA